MNEPSIRELARFRLFGRLIVVEYEGRERPAIRRVSQRAIVPVAVPLPEDLTKVCPYCAETIKAAAIVCRFCNRELGVSVPAPAPVVSVAPTRSSHTRVFALVGIGVCLLVFYFLSALGRDVPPSASRPVVTSESQPVSIEGDGLPAPYRLRQDPMPWRIYGTSVPQTSFVTYYEIIAGTDERNEVGHITAATYPDTATTDSAYAVMSGQVNQPVPLGLGDAGIQSTWSANDGGTDLVFRRCTTVVHLSLTGNVSAVLTPIAQRLDQRLQALGCST